MKVFVLGLDCAAPELVFDRWSDDLPNFRYLAERGSWGELQSSIPAITVPAWSSMLSGRDPGELGIYGFRNRADHSYEGMFIATSRYVREKRVWDYLGEHGKKSVVIGIPQTFPVSPMNGQLVSSFLTPSKQSEFTYPSSLKQELLSLAPGYEFDVPQFRTDDKDWLLQQIWDMTENRFVVVDEFLRTKPWDFFMLMEIGVDRIHHGFWSYHDPEHRKYIPGNRYERSIHDYYVALDTKLGEWLELLDEDAAVLVVSDHGAKRMEGGICLNEWLWQEGYLAFKSPPKSGKIIRFEDLEVDWSKTSAWGSGGYYGRVFLNIEGRESEGTIPMAESEAFRNELAEKLANIPDHSGNELATRVFKPEEIYSNVRGVAPDLMVYFDDLFWRSVGSLGHGSPHTLENDIGPDDCNHAENGLFILYDPHRNDGLGKIAGAQLMDICTTILDLFDLPVPAQLQGKSIRKLDPGISA